MSFDFSHYEPVSKAEAAAAGLVPGATAAPVIAPSPATAAAPVSPAPVVAFAAGGPPRQALVPLTFPIEVDGVRVDTVVVRRLRVGEVRAYVAAVQAGEEASLPMYERLDGVPLPKAALDALDSDDFDKLDAKAVDFLPRALRGDPISA